MRVSSSGQVKGDVSEQSGIPVSALFYSSQPREKDNCGQLECNPCKTETTRNINCRKLTKGGAVYSCQCLTFLREVGGEGGETSRTLYTRQKEHFKGLKKQKEDNTLWKHTELHHPGQDPPQFQFQAEMFCSTPMDKAIFEGVSINLQPLAI